MGRVISMLEARVRRGASLAQLLRMSIDIIAERKARQARQAAAVSHVQPANDNWSTHDRSSRHD